MLMKTMLNPTIKLTVLALGIGSVINASRPGRHGVANARGMEMIDMTVQRYSKGRRIARGGQSASPAAIPRRTAGLLVGPSRRVEGCMKRVASSTACSLGLVLTTLALPATSQQLQDQTVDMHAPIIGVAAGVPFVALPPEGNRKMRAPLVVVWHMVDPPRTEAAMASALPLAGVRAWKVYFGLPMFGARSPAGGLNEVMRLGAEDFVLKLFGPVVDQAAAEAPAAIKALQAQLPIDDGPIGLVGGSAGSAVVLRLLADGKLPVAAAALISPVAQLKPVVPLTKRWFGITYSWTVRSREVVDRFDFVAQAASIAGRTPQPAVLLVTGDLDFAAFREPSAALRDALFGFYADPERVSVVSVPDMAHALADPPGIEPAPQTASAKRVDAIVTDWLHRYLAR